MNEEQDKQYDDLLVEIDSVLDNMGRLEVGSDQHKRATESYEILYKLKLEQDKREIEVKEKSLDIELKKLELGIENQKANNDRNSNRIRLGVEIAAIFVPIFAYNSWYNQGLKFEKEGTITSSFFRNLLGKARFK